MIEGDLEIPERNREIALHLRALRRDVGEINERMDNFENSIAQRRFRLQDLILGSLILPAISGMLALLITKVA